MSNLHSVYLSIGSNINPTINLPKAIALLRQQGEVKAISTAYESKPVGFEGNNFLNACVLFLTSLTSAQVKKEILIPIEITLGRIRTKNKLNPRTMDIDMVLFDGTVLEEYMWAQAFVIVPLAELLPEFNDPFTGERLSHRAEQLQANAWIISRKDVAF